jgi:hypothetical protein
MWIVIFIYLGPIIYFLVSFIVDSVSDKRKRSKWKKYYGEEEIIYVTTYNNNNITPNDIMLLFSYQFMQHIDSYYIIKYKVYNDKREQNYAWSVKTTKQTYGWGIIYNIRFHFSNGWVYLSFSDGKFISNGQSSHMYFSPDYSINLGTGDIDRILDVCREESKIKWKMNGREPKGNLPFNFIPLSNNASNGTSSNSNKTNKKKEEKSSYESTIKSDLLSFYRNLLGLKLKFSREELKKSYQEAVKKYHPDRYGTSSQRDRANAEMLMKQVNEAYEKLKAVAG